MAYLKGCSRGCWALPSISTRAPPLTRKRTGNCWKTTFRNHELQRLVEAIAGRRCRYCSHFCGIATRGARCLSVASKVATLVCKSIRSTCEQNHASDLCRERAELCSYFDNKLDSGC